MERSTIVRAIRIERRLSLDFGLKSSEPIRKPHLIRTMKKKTLDFATRHASWDKEMWKKELFSDESAVQLFSVRKYGVWRLVGTRYEEKYTTPTVKYPPVKWYGERCPSGGWLDWNFCHREPPWMVKNMFICWRASLSSTWESTTAIFSCIMVLQIIKAR